MSPQKKERKQAEKGRAPLFNVEWKKRRKEKEKDKKKRNEALKKEWALKEIRGSQEEQFPATFSFSFFSLCVLLQLLLLLF